MPKNSELFATLAKERGWETTFQSAVMQDMIDELVKTEEMIPWCARYIEQMEGQSQALVRDLQKQVLKVTDQLISDPIQADSGLLSVPAESWDTLEGWLAL